MASSIKTPSKQYPKRLGTSGIRGQLYETKLLSLIYFRAIHDKNIEDIYLATNVDKVGSFDDICFRVTFKDTKKPIAVFIQAKHRENNNSVLTLNKSDLAEYFNSSSIIKRKFKLNNEDVLFNGAFDKTECLFVIYTTAKGDKKSKLYEGSLADRLNGLIRTGAPGSQPLHNEENVKLLCEIVLEEHMSSLARQMAKCIYGEFNDIQMLMKDELVIRYHAILAQKVFNVSEIQPEGHRDVSFREDFFNINDEFLRQFKDELCTEILKRRNRDNPTRYSNLLNSLMLLSKFTDPETLYKEVGSRFIYKNGKFVFLDENTPDHYKLFLDKINESQETIRRTVEMAVKECINQLSQSQSTGGLMSSYLLRLFPQAPGLQSSFVPSLVPLTTGLIFNFLNRLVPQLECFTSLKFKVPASFGNIDLTIRSNDIKIERKLNDLTSKIISFIEKSKPSNIVTIDDSMGDGFLQLNGGIASAVGNLLVFDESTKLLKFNDNYESLGNLAKKLYCKLKEKIVNCNEYKFEVKAQIFPKLSFATDEYTEKVANDFLSTLIVYTSQCNEKKVEETLIYEINNSLGDDVKHVEVTSDGIFLKYHDAIQKWSMYSKVGMGTYLEKEGTLYKNAVILSTSQPLISVINMVQRIKNKSYTFGAEAVNSIKFDGMASGTVIVTDNKALTVAKLTKQVNNRDTVVLDFEYIVNLSARDDKALRTELMHSKEVKTLIVVFDGALIATSSNSKMVNIASSMKDKRVIIVTDQKSVENAKEIFSTTGDVIKDEKNRLIDLTKESQQSILENTKVMFQGYEVSLGQILLNDSISYVTGDVLYKMMHRSQNVIGKPVINSNYKPNLYIQRSVRQYSRDKIKVEKEMTERRRREMPGFQEKLPGYVKGDRKYLQTLHDLLDAPDNNVLIIGDPGMGKSTLLTHLTLKTIEISPRKGWIVRVNLLEHTLQFSKWKDKKTNIDALQCFKFLCQAALSEASSKTFDHINITLEESNGTVNLKEFTGDEWALFELKMFLNFYNSNETLIILFDGFDEICPTYANEVLALINSVKIFSRNHKMWITSRSYNRMNTILELQFDTLFEIEPLEELEQHVYLTSLWDEQKILKDLTEDQLKNIDEFISFISQNNHHMMIIFKKIDLSPKARFEIQSRIDMPFILVCWSFMKYLKTNLTFAPSSIINGLNKLFDMYFESGIFEMEFVASPLHLNIIGNYFYHKIKEINLEPNKWNWINEYFDMYEYYLETKLKKIRYQDKTQNDMTKPDNVLAYKRDYADFMDKHKKLAAYAVYDKCLFDEDELKQFKDMMQEVKEGEERTGIICNVVDDVPIFVHSTLKEYFAVEYICDLLKNKEDQNSLWDFILNEMFFNCNNNVLTLLNHKIFLNEELDRVLKKKHKLIFDLLLQQKHKKNVNGDVQSAICEAIRHDLRYFVNIFFTIIIKDNLDKNNLEDFIKLANETNMLMLAVKMDGFLEIWTIVSVVKDIDKTKLSMLFENIGLKLNYRNINFQNISELYQKLQEHVWTRMDIVPEWKNISELSGQIYFI